MHAGVVRRTRRGAGTLACALLLAGCASGDDATRYDADAGPSATAPSTARRQRAERSPRALKPSRRRDPPPSPRHGPGPAAVVTRVVDGDTIEAAWNGRTRAIRLIGIDTPESVAPGEPVECFAKAASYFTYRQLHDRKVRLEFDVERRDRYGRTLAYVWLGRRLFNRTLVARGYAQVYTYPPNVEYVDRFVVAQGRARDRDRGLWGGCDGPNESAARASSRGRGCDPNYSGACVPRYPPDLDCSDVAASNFRSAGSDPHYFDGDSDGIACER